MASKRRSFISLIFIINCITKCSLIIVILLLIITIIVFYFIILCIKMQNL